VDAEPPEMPPEDPLWAAEGNPHALTDSATAAANGTKNDMRRFVVGPMVIIPHWSVLILMVEFHDVDQSIRRRFHVSELSPGSH